ncbi:GntR family transcriptional regulator [Variovorax terrae]|uniref:GntR family transcriptional regulator n=1 Tax=Variovorax terrae TaxID=2923278 RepID=A0A9X1VV78_9BURK|nr:GntR family transcriptional regulator [Variovorax terrae]MCJ0763764.1 GntR family transcriptional regulator [Variovorax terrae]
MPPDNDTDTALAPRWSTSRKALHTFALERLRQMIFSGELAPGERLNETSLTEQLKISRTPLREAFRSLAGEGLIELPPSRGAYVKALSETDIRHLFDLVAGLEMTAADLASRRATDQELSTIVALTHSLDSAFKRGDRAQYFALNQCIHESLVRYARNPLLEENYNNLNARVRRERFRSTMHLARWGEAMAEHLALANALTARDHATVRQIMYEHMLSGSEISTEMLIAEQQPRPADE